MSLIRIARRPHWSAWLVCAWLLLPVLAGCGGGEEEAGDQTDEQEEDNSEPLSQAEDGNGSEEGSNDPQGGTGRRVANGEEETQWIGDIPYDVYYDSPLTVAQNAETIAAVSTNTPDNTPDPMEDPAVPDPTESTGEPMTTVTPMPAAGGAVDWATVIAIEVLDEEVKQIRNRLTANLQTVANFNREQESNQVDSAVLSALAIIATLHPGELNWKEKAPYIRDLANTIYSNCTMTGREAHGVCEVAFEQITTMLDGGPAPTEPMADPNRPPSEVADRYYLMYRFRATSSHLKSNVNSADRLKEDIPGVVRELSVLSALATLITDDSYEYAVESDYENHIANFIQATTTARTGAELQSYEQFSQGIANIQKVCGECHQQYAFGTDAGI